VAIVRNLTLIKCTPGHPMTTPLMPALWGTGVSGAAFGKGANTVERKRFRTELTVVRVHSQAIDYPSHASAPTHERRP
jgi:hypothetical protein